MENKSGKAQKTKQFIVEKTATVFNKKGYVGTSLNDIMNVTGLTKGSIYGNFANKDEVALAAFDFNLKKVNQIISRELTLKSSFREKLLVYPAVYGKFLEFPFPEGGCPILNTAIEADDTHLLLKQRASDALIKWKGNLTKLIQKGMANNEFRADADPEQISLAMIASIEGAIMITKLTGKINYGIAVMKSVEKLIGELV